MPHGRGNDHIPRGLRTHCRDRVRTLAVPCCSCNLIAGADRGANGSGADTPSGLRALGDFMIHSGFGTAVADAPETTGRLLGELTGNGRISLRLACSRLTDWESLLVQHVLGRPDVELLGPAVPPAPDLVPVTRSAPARLAFW